jgi:flagella basal body P-ring formation protein FlgA
MMRPLVLILFLAGPAAAESLIATRTIRAQSVIAAQDVAQVAADIPGALTSPDQAIGLETTVTLYAGRPLHQADLAAPTLVERNQGVRLVYQSSGLTILVDGRALERGAVGDMISVMNLSSHLTVKGVVAPDGSISVGPGNKG